MLSQLRASVVMLTLFTLLTGLPIRSRSPGLRNCRARQANGSLIEQNGKVWAPS